AGPARPRLSRRGRAPAPRAPDLPDPWRLLRDSLARPGDSRTGGRDIARIAEEVAMRRGLTLVLCLALAPTARAADDAVPSGERLSALIARRGPIPRQGEAAYAGAIASLVDAAGAN